MRIPNDIKNIITKYLTKLLEEDFAETECQYYILEDKYQSYLYENEFDFDNPIIMKFETDLTELDNRIFELQQKINITKLKNID